MADITITNVAPERDAEIKESVDLAVRQASSITISDQKGMDNAAVFLRGLKTILLKINATFDRSITLAHKTHKEMLAAKNSHAGPVKKAEIIVKDTMGKYQMEQERIRREEEQRLRREEEERQRKIREEEEARLAEAVRLEEEGKADEAEAVMNAVPDVEVPKPVVVAPPPPKAQGVSMTSVWKWRLLDIYAVPSEFMMVDEKALSAYVRAKKADTRVPGISVYEEKQVAARAL